MRRPITPRGYNALRAELQKLKAQRPELSHAIEVARAHGDLSENADYDAAKNKMAMSEARINDLEHKLALADVIDPRTLQSLDRVVFGVSVIVEDADSGEERRISLVGADESDADQGRVSVESPFGRALLGKSVGDMVRVKLPAGMRDYELREIFVDYKDEAAEE